jgi:NAD(P)-dependent dehydrogenase (short-subunit alcohol dehydrogenase family)
MTRATKQTDPRTAGPLPPFPAETQAPPGIESSMRPRPDYGLDTYEGKGRLKQKIALITGGDSGIGCAVAVAFAREGADVAFSVLAPFVLVREALPHLREGSSIINVSSVQAYYPSPDILDYATTKGALVTFTKGLAQSLIERGIRVNCVAPGPVWTPLIQQSFDAKKVKEFGTNFPMKRPAQPVELAPTFVFLASDEGRYVNGEVLGVTGGRPLP